MDHSADREDLAEIIRNLGKKAEEVPEEFIELPKEFKTLTSKNKPLTAFRPIKYLKSRGLSENDIVKWKIGYCGSGRI
jgi:hypothetical protein